MKSSLRERDIHFHMHKRGENSKHKHWTKITWMIFLLMGKYYYATLQTSADSAVEHL